MKKSFIFILLIIFLGTMAGCGSLEDSVKQSVLNYIENNKNVDSLTYNGNVEVNNDVNDATTNLESSQLMHMMNNYKITFDGKLKQEPFYMETDISILTNIQGMEFIFDIPMISNDSNLYIKIPSMLKMFVPEVKEEYLMVDISNRNQTEHEAAYKEDLIKVFSKIIDAIEEKDFIRNDIKSYTIENGKVKDIITLNISQESLKSYVKNFVDNEGLSELILFSEKYSISEDLVVNLQHIKTDLDNNLQNIDQIVNDINEKVSINNFEIITVFDKDDFLRKIIFNIDITKDDEEINSLITGQFDVNTINESIQIEKQIPSMDEVTTIDNLDLSKFMSK